MRRLKSRLKTERARIAKEESVPKNYLIFTEKELHRIAERAPSQVADLVGMMPLAKKRKYGTRIVRVVRAFLREESEGGTSGYFGGGDGGGGERREALREIVVVE